MNIQELVIQANQQLLNVSQTPRLDAEVLLGYSLGVTREKLHINSQQTPTSEKINHFLDLIQKRSKGHPIAYLTGVKEFWSLPFYVDSSVLIPRPETELLISILLEKLGDKHDATIADLGTGSGAIALALAVERPSWSILATDTTKKILDVAMKNCKHFKINNVEFAISDWCDALPEIRFDAIVSNPPYIDAQDECLKSDGVCYEPREALVAGEDELEAIKKIIKQASNYLKPNGLLLMEHGCDQGEKVRALLTESGYKNSVSFKDLANHERATLGYV